MVGRADIHAAGPGGGTGRGSASDVQRYDGNSIQRTDPASADIVPLQPATRLAATAAGMDSAQRLAARCQLAGGTARLVMVGGVLGLKVVP